jgi:hypothetical protein
VRTFPSPGKSSWLSCSWLVLLSAATSLYAQPARFAIVGDASLAADTVEQRSERFTLKAHLTAPSSSTSEGTQANSRFTLDAALSTSSMVCYNDTIFRDGFDGTGL